MASTAIAATRTAPAPIQNGTCTLNCSASSPAAKGARPPPMKRTKPYAADATGRSTGATSMTAWVVRVLFTPIMAPATTTHTTSTAG